MNLQPINFIKGTRLKAKLNGNIWVVDRLWFDNKMQKSKVDIRLASSNDSKLHEGLDINLVIEKFTWFFYAN